MTKKESQTYQDMLEQVEGIIADVSKPDLDLDKLIEKVESGYHLIGTMKNRLEETKQKVEQLNAKYDDL